MELLGHWDFDKPYRPSETLKLLMKSRVMKGSAAVWVCTGKEACLSNYINQVYNSLYSALNPEP